MKAAFIPEVNDELDTQNFEKFEEVCELFIFCIYTRTTSAALVLTCFVYLIIDL